MKDYQLIVDRLKSQSPPDDEAVDAIEYLINDNNLLQEAYDAMARDLIFLCKNRR